MSLLGRPPRLTASLNQVGVLWLAVFALIVAAWASLFAMVITSPLAGAPPGLWQALCIGAASADLGSLFAMWLLMSAAMMLPTFIPSLGAFLNLGATGATRPIDAAALVLGYALVWAAGAMLGALGQRALADLGLVAPDGSSLSRWLSAGLLLVAGLNQLTRFKAACLAKCRMPLTFFMERWAPGPARAAKMGLNLGLLCFGCCWALMALAFVGGTMNLVWMGAATLFMVMEKLPDLGRVLTRPAGYLLVFAAGAHALSAILS